MVIVCASSAEMIEPLRSFNSQSVTFNPSISQGDEVRMMRLLERHEKDVIRTEVRLMEVE